MSGEDPGAIRRPAAFAGLLLLLFSAASSPVASSPPSLGETLAVRFPAIRPRLESEVRFERTSLPLGGRVFVGLRAVLPAAVSPGLSLGAGDPRLAAAAGLVPIERVRVSLPSLASDPMVAEGEGVRVVLAPLGAQAARAEVDGATVAYRDLYPETDALHVAKPDWTEEYLHLRSPSAPRRFEYEVVEAGGATRMLVDNGQVLFVGDDGKGVVVLAPVVVDAIGRRSATAARWALDTSGATRRLRLQLDPAGLDYPLLVDPTWITTGSLAAARIDPIGILLHNGRVLVTGGAASAELYDPASGTWSPTGAGWASVGNHAATLLRDGRVLACGGTDGAIYATCRRYDPGTNAWAAAASMTSARVRFTLTLLADGRVLAAGGEAVLNSPLASAEIYDPVANSWTPTGAMVRAHRSHAATPLADGRVLVAGGISLPGPSATAVSEVFDPGTGAWTQVGNLTLARAQLATVRLPDDRVLASGGGLFAVNRAEIFDPATGLWTATANLLTVRTDHSVTLLPDGRVLAAGGLNGSAHNSSEYYSPGTGLWTPGPTMAFARYRHSATLLPDGRVLVAGGWNAGALLTAELLDNDAPAWTAGPSLGTGRREPSLTLLKDGRALATGGFGLNSAEVYDPAGAGSWTPTTNNLLGVRYRHTATLLGDGRVLVAGSVTSAAVGITAEVYDPPSNRWFATGSMTIDRYWHTATLLPCGEVLVVGGQTAGSTVLRSAERYNPKTGTWRPTGSLATGRWKHTATLLADGRVLVTGGFNGGQLASAEVYDPATETWSATAGPMTAGRYHHLATLLPSGRVLISGGFNSVAADLFNPATGTFAATGPAPVPIGFGSSLGLLPNGRVLALAGFFAPSAASVYDPGEGTWTAGPVLAPGRDTHAAALLADGRVLVVGADGAADNSTALFDVGRGELLAWRPVVATMTDPLLRGTPLNVTGTGFQGLGDGSTGLGYMHSATNYPLVQLRRLDNEQVRWLPVEPTVGWSGTSFRSTPVNGFPNGPALATVFTNGIPGVSRSVTVECPPPTIDVPPASASVCAGTSAVLSVAATAPGSDCPAYRWRKDGVLLSDGPPFSGTQTPTLTVSPAGLGEAGSYTVEVSLACSSTVVTSAPAALSVHAAMGAVDASISGPASVCSTCLGGILSETHTGGGAAAYQWGYRTTSGGATTDIPFATSPTYVLNGADLPGVGNYFLVVRVAPACGVAAFSDEVPVTVANTAGPADEVPFFTVTSRDSQNVLEWVYPAGYSAVRIHATTGTPCVYQTDPLALPSLLSDESGTAGAPDRFVHGTAANGTTYCYTIFVDTGGGTWSAGRDNSGTPFATGGPLKWAFHSGMFSTTAPTVGAAGVLAVNNDNAVHAMTRGPGGGEWPGGWKPLKLGGAVQSRSPVIPIPVGSSSQVMFLGAQDGNVYAVDAVTGAAAAAPWPGPAALGGLVQAAPAGEFSALGATYNYLLVGTRVAGADNVFRALDPGNGALLGSFDNGGGASGIGIISSMATVDLATNRVYFTSAVKAGGSANTLWCLQLGPPGPVLGLVWARALGSIESGPVLRGGRVYVGSTNAGGTLYSINAATGSSADDRTYVHGDGPVKGFVFPDRFSATGDLYFAANTRVWGVTEIGAVLANKFAAGIALPGGAVPSTLLFHPGSHYVYVGGSNGWVYQIDTLASPPTADYAVELGPSPLTIGAPTLDNVYSLLHVGSEPGTFFAIQVPVAPASLCTASCLGKPIGTACTTTAPPCSQSCDGAGNCN